MFGGIYPQLGKVMDPFRLSNKRYFIHRSVDESVDKLTDCDLKGKIRTLAAAGVSV